MSPRHAHRPTLADRLLVRALVASQPPRRRRRRDPLGPLPRAVLAGIVLGVVLGVVLNLVLGDLVWVPRP